MQAGWETRFAVVVTSYNYRDYVLEAVESALRQTRKAAQVIVVDDGSTDGSDTLLRERYQGDPRVTLVCTENRGQLAAFQRGVALVEEADVVCFLDSDDRWKADYLMRIGALYDERPDVDFVFTDLQCFDREHEVVRFHANAVDLGYTVLSTYMLTAWYGVATSATSIRLEWARRVFDLPRDFRETWRAWADCCSVYGSSMLGASKYYLPTGCVEYRIHDRNASFGEHGRERVRDYRLQLNTRCLIAHYAKVANLDATCCRSGLCKSEFKTKASPPWFETRRYSRMAMVSCDRPAWKRWERAVSILRRGWKSRHA